MIFPKQLFKFKPGTILQVASKLIVTGYPICKRIGENCYWSVAVRDFEDNSPHFLHLSVDYNFRKDIKIIC